MNRLRIVFLALALLLANTLAVCADETPRFTFEFGSLGSGNGEFDRIGALAVDRSGFVYTVDAALNRVQKFDQSGVYQTRWGATGSSAGNFSFPFGIAVGLDGTLFVTDSQNYRVQRFHASGAYMQQWATNLPPLGITCHPDGNLYVSSVSTAIISVFNTNGILQFQWDTKETGNGDKLFVQDLTVGIGGSVFTPDILSNRVWKWDTYGTYITLWGSSGADLGQFDRPQGCDTDSIGNIYVADINNHRVQKFDSTGTYLLSFGSHGSGPGQFINPTDVEVLSPGYLYVADRGNARVQVFTTVDNPPRVNVLSPESGSYLIPGEQIQIEWNANDESGIAHVDISLVTETRLYGSIGAGGFPWGFYEIDPHSGTETQIGLIGFNRVGAMATEPATGRVLAAAQRQSTDVPVLIEIDPTTGQGTELGPTGIPGNITDMSFDRVTGRLWAHRAAGSSGLPTEFYEIDPWTGAASLIGSSFRSGGGGGFAFALNNRARLMLTPGESPEISSVNLITGKAVFQQALLMPSSPGPPRIRAMDHDPLHGFLYALVHDGFETYLARINTGFGVLTKIQTLGATDLDGLCFGPGPAIPIAIGQPNTGSYTWTVPNTPTNAGRIKITAYDMNSNAVSDMNGGFINILNVVGASDQAARLGISLRPPTPNPFSSETRVQYRLPRQMNLKIRILDSKGRLVRDLFRGTRPAGEGVLVWDGRDDLGRRVSPGHYYLELASSTSRITQSIVLIR